MHPVSTKVQCFAVCFQVVQSPLLLLLPRLEACPVFQATSGHPGKPLAIRAGAKVWPSRPSSDLLANLRQQPARQKLGPTHCPLAQSPLSGSSAECRIIIEYQNALSPVLLLSSIQLFTSLSPPCCCSLTMRRFCFSKSASNLVPHQISPCQMSPPKILNCEEKILQIRRNRENLASVKKLQDCYFLQL